MKDRLAGIVFIPLGFFFLWFSTEQGHLVCEREIGQTGECYLEHSNFYGHQSSARFTTDEIQSVRAGSYDTKFGDNHYAQICLSGRNVLISNEHNGSREAVISAVNQVQSFKDSPEIQRLELTLGSEPEWKWGVLLFSFFGLVLLFRQEN